MFAIYLGSAIILYVVSLWCLHGVKSNDCNDCEVKFGPHNLVVKFGRTARMTCQTSDKSVIFKRKVDEEIYSSGKLRPNSIFSTSGRFHVNKTKISETLTEFELIIGVNDSVRLEDAGVYTCVDVETRKEHSAQLIVLGGDPECTDSERFSDTSCRLRYSGNWSPTMHWSIQTYRGPFPLTSNPTIIKTNVTQDGTVIHTYISTAKVSELKTGGNLTCRTNFNYSANADIVSSKARKDTIVSNITPDYNYTWTSREILIEELSSTYTTLVSNHSPITNLSATTVSKEPILPSTTTTHLNLNTTSAEVLVDKSVSWGTVAVAACIGGLVLVINIVIFSVIFLRLKRRPSLTDPVFYTDSQDGGYLAPTTGTLSSKDCRGPLPSVTRSEISNTYEQIPSEPNHVYADLKADSASPSSSRMSFMSATWTEMADTKDSSSGVGVYLTTTYYNPAAIEPVSTGKDYLEPRAFCNIPETVFEEDTETLQTIN